MTASLSNTRISRRDVLSGAAALGATALLPSSLSAAMGAASASAPPRWQVGFQNPAAKELKAGQLKLLHGKLPGQLSGSLYRNGPAVFERGGVKMQHWFDGDGMLQAFRFEDGQVAHHGRVLDTPKFAREEQLSQFTVGGFATHIDSDFAISKPDDLNASNTSVMSLGGELFTLWEGGSALQVDSETLDAEGFKVWGEGLQGMPFSAHPRFETDGSCWNFGQDYFGQRLIIYRLDANGGLIKTAVVQGVPAGMIHDFTMTKNKLIFVVPSFRMNRNANTFLGRFSWEPDTAQRVIVLDKNDLNTRKEYELPVGFQFHYGNAWETANGEIRFSACSGDDHFITQGARDVLKGITPEISETTLKEYLLRKDGRAETLYTVDKWCDYEFPQFNSRYTGQASNFLYTVGKQLVDRPGPSAIIKHDLTKQKETVFDYGENQIVEEHLFIPTSNARGEDHGWLIGTTLNIERARTQIHVHDAQAIEAGPVATLELPYAIPLGFHGTWVSSSA